jgi:hypothetical protein
MSGDSPLLREEWDSSSPQKRFQAVRLTLRTLLAYLDDQLEPAEIKQIGQKVAESDAAQELIARIKQVTRRRRLLTPPSGKETRFDANDVAEYLDNELDADKVAELEKHCLESDVHLAEIAACHQILALVLGEPALVPPTAKERMYGLVQGREAIPYRKAAPARMALGDALDEDETLGLGGKWLSWALPVAGLLLVVALGLAVYQVLPDRSRDDRRALVGTGTGTGQTEKGTNGQQGTEKVGKEKGNGKKNGKAVKPGGNGTNGETGKTKGPDEAVSAIPAPSKERKAIGQYAGGVSTLPTALVRRQGDGAPERVAKDAAIHTADTLITLPGFVSELRTAKGVKVIQRGSLREYALAAPMLHLLESAVVLHASDKFDLDLTLLRGRIFLRNNKAEGACKVRLRLDEETWDLTLPEPGDEVGVDLTHVYTALLDPKTEPPQRDAYLAALRGDVQVTVNAFTNYTMKVEPPKFALMHYSSTTKTQPPQNFDSVPLAWLMEPPPLDKIPEDLRDRFKGWAAEVAAVKKAVTDLETLLGVKRKTVTTAVTELRENDTATPQARKVAIYAMGALDDLSKLIDALGDGNARRNVDREAAFFTLRAWASRGPDMAKALYDPAADSGLLIEKNFKSGEAKAICDLLYPFQTAQLRRAETYQYLVVKLQSAKIAIAEMAFQHLYYLCPPKALPQERFNAADGFDERKAYAMKVEALIEKKVLPPGGLKEEEKEKKEKEKEEKEEKE